MGRSFKNEANTNLLIKELPSKHKDLRLSLEFKQAKMDAMVKANSDLKQKLEEMVKSKHKLEEKVSLLENQIKSSNKNTANLEKKLNDIAVMHDDLEQYTRKFNLEVYGVPEEEEEDSEQLILGLARCMEIDLHCMKKGNTQPRPIIVRFTNYY